MYEKDFQNLIIFFLSFKGFLEISNAEKKEESTEKKGSINKCGKISYGGRLMKILWDCPSMNVIRKLLSTLG